MVLTPGVPRNGAVSGDRAFWEVIKVERGHSGELEFSTTGVLVRGGDWNTEGRPREDTGEAGGSCKLRKAVAETSPVDTLILDSSLQICEKVRLCSVRHPVCGILFL